MFIKKKKKAMENGQLHGFFCFVFFFLILAKVMNCPQVYVQPFKLSNKKGTCAMIPHSCKF